MKTVLFLASLLVGGMLHAQIYQNTTPVNVPDATNVTGDCGSATAAGNASRVINVPLSDTITDPSKVTFNLNIAHTWLGDVVAELRTPAGNSCALIKRLGTNGPSACGVSANFVAGNTFSFASGNAVTIPYENLTSSDNIPAGVYMPTEGQDSTHYPALIPLCDLDVFLGGVSVSGNWALVMYDNGVGDVGSIQSWQIIFAPGFGDPVSHLGVEQELILSNSISVLGNPFTDRLSLTLNTPGSTTVLYIYTVDGREIYQKPIHNVQAGTAITLETDAWKAGMYLIVPVVEGRKQQAIKVVKQ